MEHIGDAAWFSGVVVTCCVKKRESDSFIFCNLFLS